jgi:hypothetical protein
MGSRTLYNFKAVALRNLRPGHHADGGGLYVAVSPNGVRRSWVLRTRRDGRLREIGLESLDAVSLETRDARLKRCAPPLLNGAILSLKSARRRHKPYVENARATTFKQAAARYIANQEAGRIS